MSLIVLIIDLFLHNQYTSVRACANLHLEGEDRGLRVAICNWHNAPVEQVA
jgi:hypothetical protein